MHLETAWLVRDDFTARFRAKAEVELFFLGAPELVRAIILEYVVHAMALALKRLSPEQYLAREARAQTRSEYVAGELYAMVGATLRHNRLALNVSRALLVGLAKKRCQVFMSDVKLRVSQLDAFFYPDVMVCCGVELDQSKVFVEDAQLIIEILSSSTEKIDRDLKLKAYRKVPTLKEYVLISQERRQVELYRRAPQIGWTYLSFEGDETAKFESVGLKMSLSAVYASTSVR